MKYDVIRSYWPAPIYSDGSTLDLDFLTGTLDSRLTFTRAAGTATYINSSGYVTTAAANTPRFDYDPVTLAPRGLLIEGTAINLLKNSAYADTNWIAFGGYTKSITTGITSPANDTTAARVTFTAVGHGLYTNNTQMGYTNTVGATYTMSAWIRATSNTTNLNIRFGDSAVATGPNIPISTTWTRYSYSYVAASASGPLVQSASGTATGEFEMWGFQLELGSGASSYIPTGASQVTRNPDYCQSTVASGIAGWLTSLTTSTYFVDFVPMTQRGAFANTWNTRTSTFQGYEIYCFDGTAGVNLTCTTKISASTNVETNVASGLALNSRHKIAYSISAGSGLRSVNGSTVSAANPVALPTGTPSTFGVGSGGGGSGTSINAWIRSVKYYPTALTQTEINGITAA